MSPSDRPQQHDDATPASPPSAIEAAVAKRGRRREQAAKIEAARIAKAPPKKEAKPKKPKLSFPESEAEFVRVYKKESWTDAAKREHARLRTARASRNRKPRPRKVYNCPLEYQVAFEQLLAAATDPKIKVTAHMRAVFRNYEGVDDNNPFLRDREDRREFLAKVIRERIEARRAKIDQVLDRTRNGYSHGAGFVGTGKKYYQEARTYPLRHRSKDHPHLQRVVASTRAAKSGELLTGMQKNERVVQWSKQLALDNLYIAFNPLMRDMWRHDIDRRFGSIEELMAALVKLNIPMPHIITWTRDDREPGVIKGCALLYMLPDGRAVFGTGRQFRKMMGVIAALNVALEAIGADRGGLAYPFDSKSPICLHNDYYIGNDTSMLDLDGYGQVLDVKLDSKLHLRVREAAELKDIGIENSNPLLTYADDKAYATGRDLIDRGIFEPLKLGFDQSAFAWAINQHLERKARADGKFDGLDQRQVARLLKSFRVRSTTVAAALTKWKTSDVDRGACHHLIAEEMTEAERQAIGGAHGGGSNSNRHRAAVGQAIKTCAMRKIEPTDKNIATITGFDIRTVRKYLFQEVVSVVADVMTSILTLEDVLRVTRAKQYKGKGEPPTPETNTTADTQDPAILELPWSADSPGNHPLLPLGPDDDEFPSWTMVTADTTYPSHVSA